MEVYVAQKANLPKSSFIQTDNIHAIPKNSLVKYLGTLDSSTMQEVSKKIVLALGLENCF